MQYILTDQKIERAIENIDNIKKRTSVIIAHYSDNPFNYG